MVATTRTTSTATSTLPAAAAATTATKDVLTDVQDFDVGSRKYPQDCENF